MGSEKFDQIILLIKTIITSPRISLGYAGFDTKSWSLYGELPPSGLANINEKPSLKLDEPYHTQSSY